MALTESFVLLAFLLVGVVVGYVTFLIFRIALRQQKFDWSGALSVITSLAGGGFLSYWSQPRNFAAYGIGFFIGFAAYWRFLQSGVAVTGSAAASLRNSESEVAADKESDEAPDDKIEEYEVRRGKPIKASHDILPEAPGNLIRTITDVTLPTEHRVRALLALRTDIHSDSISVTDSLRDDLALSDFDLLVLPIILRMSPPTENGPIELNTVKDLVNLIDGIC